MFSDEPIFELVYEFLEYLRNQTKLQMPAIYINSHNGHT